jgi:hypothetical protein
MAERVGFEPTVGGCPTTVFETVAFDHSATSPVLEDKQFFVFTIKQKACSFRISSEILKQENGGGDEIRTHGTVSRTPAFQASAFNHSATPPQNAS